MQKVLISSIHNIEKLKQLLRKYNFKIVNKNPNFVLVYGGDGSTLFSERFYPSIPKLLVKRNEICRKCDYTVESLKLILPRIKDGKFKIRNEIKLEAKFGNKKLTALNEIQLHTKLPIRAVRFSLSVVGKKFENLIGDGVIISTPFGSPAYFSSAGGQEFRKGIGICFNNLHNKKIKSFVVPESSTVKIKITRDNAWLASDNYEKMFSLKSNDIVAIRKSKQSAKFITF